MATTTAAEAPARYRGPYDLTEDQELFKRTVHEFVEREHEYLSSGGRFIGFSVG